MMGPIPAGAGKPLSASYRVRYQRAYPRWRGETVLDQVGVGAAQGLSPLARGNHNVLVHTATAAGPIPAGAGKPSPAALSGKSARAYPRWRGETRPTQAIARRYWGLSPLARGNPAPPARREQGRGPIPAGAGKPAPSVKKRRTAWAYPRWRGETRRPLGIAEFPKGLSPLARGNPGELIARSDESGPIPAGAGKPR